MRNKSIITAAAISIIMLSASVVNSQSRENSGVKEINYYPGCPDNVLVIKPESARRQYFTASLAQAGKKVNSVRVKNIWKEMPSYDKYGNEITARARYNMRMNAMLEKMKREKSTETSGKQEAVK